MKSHTRILTFTIAVALGLVGFRLYLPTLVKNYLNRTLNKISGYRGHVEEVHLHLWRGAYSVIDLELNKIGGRIPVPFFSAKKNRFLHSLEASGFMEICQEKWNSTNLE